MPLLLLSCGGESRDEDGPPGGAPADAAAVRRPGTAPGGGPGEGGRPGGPAREVTGLYAPPSGAGGGLFTPCGTDRVWIVAPDGGAEALRRRVLLDGAGGDGPTRVTVRGWMGGTGGEAPPAGETGDTAWIDEVVGVSGASDCPEAPAARPLEGTAWQLVGLPAPDPAIRGAGAWLRLRPEPAVVEGSTGCRDLSGRYDWTVTRLRFSRLDDTAAMCPRAELHADLLAALARTGSYRIRGDTLELLGETGVVATFEAPER